MSISKKPLKGKDVTKVTFKAEKDLVPGAQTVSLVGDFNGWDQSAHPMKGTKTGSFSIAVDLESGKSYEFRYLVDGQQWVNDPEADSHTTSPFPDAQNSVLSL
jgi:1,4-alpha-glucan branching enzyme